MNWHILLPGLFLLLIILTWLGSRRIQKLAPLGRQLRLLFTMLFISLVIFVLNTPPIAELADFTSVLRIVWLLLIFLIMVLTIRLIRHIVFDWLIGRQLMERRLKVVEDVSGIVLYVIGILLIADNYLNIQITPLLATSAIITIVAGFALQNILGDLFSGLALNFDESLRIGDWIQLGSIEGRIEQLRWRSMKIRTRDGHLVLVPNQTASKETVTVYGNLRNDSGVRLTIGVSYDNSPDEVMELIRQKVRQMDNLVENSPIDIWISSFDDFAVVYTIRFHITDPALRERICGQLRHHLWYAFRRQNITIPYPIRTIINAPEKGPKNEQEIIMRALGANEILAQLPSELRQRVATLSELLLFGQNEEIIREEEEGRAFHILLSGQVTVNRKGQRLTTLSAGDYFGEMALFTGEKTTATVVSLVESRVLRIAAADFRDLVAMNEQSAQAISQVIARRRAGIAKQDEERSRRKKILIGSESASIFQRIRRYFDLSPSEDDSH